MIYATDRPSLLARRIASAPIPVGDLTTAGRLLFTVPKRNLIKTPGGNILRWFGLRFKKCLSRVDQNTLAGECAEMLFEQAKVPTATIEKLAACSSKPLIAKTRQRHMAAQLAQSRHVKDAYSPELRLVTLFLTGWFRNPGHCPHCC